MKQRLLIISLVALVGLMIALNFGRKDWLGPRDIQIGYRSLPSPGSNAVEPLVFLLDRRWQLTSVQVVLAEDAKTNAHPRALWDLVSHEGSQPVTYLHYGASLPGMTSRYAGVNAEKLSADTTYRIILQGKGRRGERDFTLKPGPGGR
jgi:hypothetical protein